VVPLAIFTALEFTPHTMPLGLSKLLAASGNQNALALGGWLCDRWASDCANRIVEQDMLLYST
jgi:hypothetical protein